MKDFLTKETVELIFKDFRKMCENSLLKMRKYSSLIEEEDLAVLATLGDNEIRKITEACEKMNKSLSGCKGFDPKAATRYKNETLDEIRRMYEKDQKDEW